MVVSLRTQTFLITKALLTPVRLSCVPPKTRWLQPSLINIDRNDNIDDPGYVENLFISV